MWERHVRSGTNPDLNKNKAPCNEGLFVNKKAKYAYLAATAKGRPAILAANETPSHTSLKNPNRPIACKGLKNKGL